MITVLLLVIYIGLELLRPEQLLGTLSQYGSAMMLVAVLTVLAFQAELLMQPGNWRKSIALRFMILLPVVALGSATLQGFTQRPTEGLVELSQIAVMFGIVVQSVRTPARLAVVRTGLLIVIVYLAVGGVAYRGFGYFDWPGFSSDKQGRLQYMGTLADSNDLSQVYVVGWTLLIFSLINIRGIARKLVELPLLALLGTAIYYTESRGAILAVLVGLVLAMRRKVGLVGPAVLALILLVAMNQLGVARMDTLSTQESSAEGRIKAWGQGWYMLRSHPLFGVGAKNFNKWHPVAAHSTMVQVAGELGFLGLICWIGFFYASVRHGLGYLMPGFVRGIFDVAEMAEPPPKVQQMQAAMLTTLVTSAFLSRAYVFLPYLMAGLAMAAWRSYAGERETEVAAGERPDEPNAGASWPQLALQPAVIGPAPVGAMRRRRLPAPEVPAMPVSPVVSRKQPVNLPAGILQPEHFTARDFRGLMIVIAVWMILWRVFIRHYVQGI